MTWERVWYTHRADIGPYAECRKLDGRVHFGDRQESFAVGVAGHISASPDFILTSLEKTLKSFKAENGNSDVILERQLIHEN